MSDLDDEFDVDLGDCPYLARFHGLPGHDPQGICAYGCYDEPACITCEPDDGWPKMHAQLAATFAGKLGPDAIVLVCARTDTRPAPLPDATVGHCDSCGTEVWVGASAPAEASVRLCLRCAPMLMAAQPVNDPAQFMATTPAQRAVLREAGVSDELIDQAQANVTEALQHIVTRQRGHHD